MPENTPGGWPYVLPADHPLEYPAASQTLANKLDTVAVKGDAAWTTPGSLLNGWVNYGAGTVPFRYRKVAGLVTVQGTIKSGSVNTVFQLPAGYRIGGGFIAYFNGAGNSGSSVSMYVDSSGNVNVVGYGTGATNAIVMFHITYPEG